MYEWDESKRKINMAKHFIDFADVPKVFEGSVHIESAISTIEERWMAVGMLDDVEVTVIYTMRDGNIRLISARRSRKHERGKYRSLLSRADSGNAKTGNWH